MKRAIILFIVCLILIISCARKEPIALQRMVLGTVVNVTLEDAGDVKDTDSAINAVFKNMEELDVIWAYSAEGSDIFALSQNAGGGSVDLDKRTFELLASGVKLEALTEEYFNMRLGSVTGLWGFHSGAPSIPGKDNIAEMLKLTKGGMFFAGTGCLLGKKGMILDIGGIGKGFAVDLAVEQLFSAGVNAGIVEAGGDLKVFGIRNDGKPWRIGIRHPRDLGSFYGIAEISTGAAATSGDYQQSFKVEGKLYHHIIDPNTGYPADKCVSATAFAENCMEADAVATALFVMGAEKGMAWLVKHPEYKGLIIYQDKDRQLRHVLSEGLNISFTP